ncbi:alpha/beta fold hydrolase [Nocardia africana]|nr:alpha/beta hydrolase [Nocardia africana]MCC3314184.1 alpha/beta hydrolase [Nocardia africana]
MASTAPTRDGRRLYYMHRPGRNDNRSPLVVFESGLACTRSYWAAVQREFDDYAATVVYDRSGLGRSAPDTAPRGLRRLADDLVDLLDHLTERFAAPRLVLVGHSWGGPIVRVAAADRPDRITGTVLVDPTDEFCDDLFTTASQRAARTGQRLSAALARIGALRLAYRDTLAALPADARAEFRAEGFAVAAMRTRAAELACHTADLEHLHRTAPDRHQLAVTVVSADSPSTGISARSRAAINAAHRRRAARPHGRHVVAEHCGHMVPTERPGLVAAEIVRIIEEYGPGARIAG